MISIGRFLRELAVGPPQEDARGALYSFRYRRFWRTAVLLQALFCIVPLIVMTVVNYYQYQHVLGQEVTQPLHHVASNTKRTLEFFLEERRAALNYIVRERSFEELATPETLRSIFRSLKQSFGDFIDIGLTDSSGKQRTYEGPYALLGMNYASQAWFHEVDVRGVYVSDMFSGYRHMPHFVIAVKHEDDEGNTLVLRTTIDMDMLHKQIRSLSLEHASDAFIINRDGVLQTPSRIFGPVMNTYTLPVPAHSESTKILEQTAPDGKTYILAYSYIQESPFLFMLITDAAVIRQSWFVLRRNLLIFLAVSIVVILLLICVTSTYVVGRLREADRKRTALYHEMEYTNKMASIGRLSAGVAHEINNPLAIINEKAGLLKDIVSLGEDFPQKERVQKFADSIVSSVDRCSTITHRLLGFARHMDIQSETVDLDNLIHEVLGFLEKEASYRDVQVSIHADDKLPLIQSDRGQLQQVFLNIINNAFAAVDDGGEITIALEAKDKENVSVSVTDNGCGIPREHLDTVFDPFFSTKGSGGTGLGLSVSYGIVGKLGGQISVESEVGVSTHFVLTLPINRSRF